MRIQPTEREESTEELFKAYLYNLEAKLKAQVQTEKSKPDSDEKTILFDILKLMFKMVNMSIKNRPLIDTVVDELEALVKLHKPDSMYLTEKETELKEIFYPTGTVANRYDFTEDEPDKTTGQELCNFFTSLFTSRHGKWIHNSDQYYIYMKQDLTAEDPMGQTYRNFSHLINPETKGAINNRLLI